MYAVFLLIAIPIAYFLPSLVLAWRETPGAAHLFAINLLFGWLVLPWLYLMTIALLPRD